MSDAYSKANGLDQVGKGTQGHESTKSGQKASQSQTGSSTPYLIIWCPPEKCIHSSDAVTQPGSYGAAGMGQGDKGLAEEEAAEGLPGDSESLTESHNTRCPCSSSRPALQGDIRMS